MAHVIETTGLTKLYGKVVGIEDLDLTVDAGEILGFLGPNGAGKSTTIRLLLDFIRPTSGSGRVLGLDARRDSIEIHRRVGYLPGELAMYDAMTGREMLGFFASLRGIDGLGRAPEVAERLELDLTRKVKAYSSGNRQKLGLSQAFLHNPELLILDEPTNALDPLIQQEFYALVEEMRDEGKTVFLSSHILPEVERIADRVAIIRHGRLVTVESITELKRKARRRIELRFATTVDPGEFDNLPSVVHTRSHDDGRVVEITLTGTADGVIKTAAQHEVVSVVSHDGDLEEAFLAYYEGDGDAG